MPMRKSSEKTGYCLQKEKRYKEAIEAYRKADVLKPDHVWTIRHLATCHRQLRDFATALEYYRKAEAMQPENRNLPFLIGSCLAEQERYEEALQCSLSWISWKTTVSGMACHKAGARLSAENLNKPCGITTRYLP